MDLPGVSDNSIPAKCECGEWFDMRDGNQCSKCQAIFCDSCLHGPISECSDCQYVEDYLNGL